MPDSTANGITYPVPGDYVKAAEFASKLAKDFETLALTADQAIVAGVAQGIIPVLSGYVKPKPIPSGTDLLTLDTGWWYNRLTSVAGTMLNRPQGVTDGPFMVHMVRTPFGHSTITYYGYSGTAGGLFENHTGNAAHTAWVGWRRLDGTTGGGITQGSGLAGFANILRTQMFRDAMGPVTTGGKGAIAFRFDHGLSKFNSIMRPLLEARGIKYSLALSSRNFSAGENAGVSASMVNGWVGAEVWNHGANQHQDESSVTGLTDQIVTGLAELQAALPNKQIWGYAVPGTGGSGQGGFFGGATAEQFYETAAGDLILTNHAVSSGSMSGTSRRPLDGRIRQGMAHFTIEAQTVARIKSEIDNAISNKTGNQLMMHPNLLNTEGYLTTAHLVEVLDYVVAKRDAGELVVLSPYEMLVAQLSTSGGSGVPGPPGAGVPAGGEALQVIRKNAFNTTTEWATLTKSLVGLSNVDNTSDMNKPVSTMQKLALDEKIDAAKLPDEIDSANKNLIENPASLTANAINAAIVKQQVELDVRSFGDFAEDSDWTVNRDAMQAANDYATTLPAGAVVKLPAGTFKVKGVTQDSHVTFQGHGTTLEHPDGLSGHMIIARTFATTGTIAAGSFDLTVASESNIEVGTVVAITGARGLSDRQNTLLASAIDSTQTTGITLADPYGFPLSGHMTVGSEVIKYTGISAGVLTGVTRGMYGTTAAAHGTVGPVDAIGVSAHHIAQVVAVSGTTVTIDRPAPYAMTGAPVNFSIVDPGIYDIGIEGNRDTTAQVHYPVYWATVGNGHGDNFYAHHAQTTIFLGLGATGNRFGTVTADSCLLRNGIGASFWMFQSCRDNVVKDLRVTGAMFIGVYIDDRTTIASPFDGPGEDNHVGRISLDIPVTVPMHQLTENTIGLLVSGGLNNYVGEMNVSGVRTGMALEHGGQWQNWNDVPPTCEGNVVGVFRGKNIYQPWYIDAPGNSVLDAAYKSYLALGVTTGNPHIGHAIGPNGEQATRYHDGSQSVPAIAFRAEQGTGFYRPSAGMLQFTSQGAAAVRFWGPGIRMESGKHILFGADNTGDVGGLGGSRPRDVRAARVVATGVSTEATRIAPNIAGAGAMTFDSDLKKPYFTDGLIWRDVLQAHEINSTGLSSFQIDGLFPSVPTNGQILSDPTNGLVLIKQNGKWAKTAVLTVIA